MVRGAFAVLGLVVLTVFVGSAEAKTHRKKAATSKATLHEQYSATENEGDQAPETRPLTMDMTTPATAGAELIPVGDSAAEEPVVEGAPELQEPALPPAPAPVVAATPAEVAPMSRQEARVDARTELREEIRFDAVPGPQKDAIRRRLQIVDLLVARYGRAYDYRTHTVRELEQIRANLDASVRR